MQTLSLPVDRYPCENWHLMHAFGETLHVNVGMWVATSTIDNIPSLIYASTYIKKPSWLTYIYYTNRAAR